jgi:hypothetical protein
MLSRAHALNFLEVEGRRVKGSDPNAKKMCKILFGDFKRAKVSWSHEREQEFLNCHGREHMKEPTKEDNKKIGCHRSQITMSKIAQVKNINRNFMWKIQMSVPKELKGDRNGRRRKGTSASPTKQR